MFSKKIFFLVSFISIVGFVGCGDDSSSNSGTNSDDLPEKVWSIKEATSLKCDESVKCAKVFVEDGMVDDYFQCDGSQWFPATDTKFKELCPTKEKTEDETSKPESSSGANKTESSSSETQKTESSSSESGNKEGVSSSDSNGGSSDSGEISEEDKKQAALVAELGTCTESCDKKIDTTVSKEVYICEWKDEAGLWRKLTSAELDSIENEAILAQNKAAGENFLKQHRTVEGVVTTESGLQYKMITEGAGATPTDDDNVIVRYTTKLLDGTTTFESEFTTVPIGSFIPGIIELLKLMKVGEKCTAWVPSDLAYGREGNPPTIPGYSVLVYEIELLKVIDSNN